MEGRTALAMTVSDAPYEWSCFAITLEEDRQCLFSSSVPVTVPPNRLPAMIEALARANFGLPIGNFEIDLTDGELRYKTSIDVDNSDLDAGLVRTLVYANISVTRRYLPALYAVANDGVEPAEAIKTVEE